jgi:hypothetical protein
MREVLILWLALAVSCATPCAYAASSILRIDCDGADEGANVTLNGTPKGQCPVDIKVEPGTMKLRVEKSFGEGRIGRYERDVRVGEGVVQRIQVVLASQLTEQGRKAAEQQYAGAVALYERLQQQYEASLLTQQDEVRQCGKQMSDAENLRIMDCWTNSGGCVGPWPCENSEKRFQRCSSSGRGFSDASDYTNACKARLPKLDAPVRPTLETK